jgi:hypothetical protein
MRMSRIVAAFIAGGLIVMAPQLSSATIVPASVTIDLLAQPFGINGSALAFLTTPVSLNAGDTLSLDVFFAGTQAIQISEIGTGESVTLEVFTDSPSEIGVQDYTLTLSGVSGDAHTTSSVVTNDLNNTTTLVARLSGDVTDSQLTFTDIHATFTPYINVTATEVVLLTAFGTASVLTAPVPEPMTVTLVGLGITGVAARWFRRRRTE